MKLNRKRVYHARLILGQNVFSIKENLDSFTKVEKLNKWVQKSFFQIAERAQKTSMRPTLCPYADTINIQTGLFIFLYSKIGIFLPFCYFDE